MPLPPDALPLQLNGQLRKRWRWVGGFGEELMLCAAYARVGPMARSWWAVWDRASGRLHEDAGRGRRGVHLPAGRVIVDGVLDLSYAPLEPVENVSPHGRAHIWTGKQGGIRLRGTATIDGRTHGVDLAGLVDDSAGYHAHRTDWFWSAGVGTAASGAAVAWNLVTGLHDDAATSERTVWVDGTPHHVAPVQFAPDLSAIAGDGTRLRFAGESTRAHEEDFGLFGSSYEQPFGTFAGALPVAGELATAYGVMERHSARW